MTRKHDRHHPALMKASDKSKKAWHEAGGIYPLYGFSMIDGRACEVEDLRGSWRHPDPTWEIHAPEGMHFRFECTHTYLCWNLAEVRDFAHSAELEPCDQDCGGLD